VNIDALIIIFYLFLHGKKKHNQRRQSAGNSALEISSTLGGWPH